MPNPNPNPNSPPPPPPPTLSKGTFQPQTGKPLDQGMIYTRILVLIDSFNFYQHFSSVILLLLLSNKVHGLTVGDRLYI